MRKSDCTPEQWERYKAKAREWRLRNLEKDRAQKRAYSKTEEAKAKRRAYDMKPDVVERRKARQQTAEYKEQRRRSREAAKSDPVRQSKRIADQRKRRTGMGPDVIAALMVQQNGCCAICNRSFEGKQVRADHCHDSGSPRGLLCHHCNIMEGMLKGMGMSPQTFADRLCAYLSHPPILRLGR